MDRREAIKTMTAAVVVPLAIPVHENQPLRKEDIDELVTSTLKALGQMSLHEWVDQIPAFEMIARTDVIAYKCPYGIDYWIKK